MHDDVPVLARLEGRAIGGGVCGMYEHPVQPYRALATEQHRFRPVPRLGHGVDLGRNRDRIDAVGRQFKIHDFELPVFPDLNLHTDLLGQKLVGEIARYYSCAFSHQFLSFKEPLFRRFRLIRQDIHLATEGSLYQGTPQKP